MSEEHELPRVTDLEELFLSRDFGSAPVPHAAPGSVPGVTAMGALSWSPVDLRAGAPRPLATVGAIGTAAALAVVVGLCAMSGQMPSGLHSLRALGSSGGAPFQRPDRLSPAAAGFGAGASTPTTTTPSVVTPRASSSSDVGVSAATEPAHATLDAVTTAAPSSSVAPNTSGSPSASPATALIGATASSAQAQERNPADVNLGLLTPSTRTTSCRDNSTCGVTTHTPPHGVPAPPAPNTSPVPAATPVSPPLSPGGPTPGHGPTPPCQPNHHDVPLPTTPNRGAWER